MNNANVAATAGDQVPEHPIEIWTTRLDLDADAIAACAALLSPDEIARMRRFRPEHKRREFTITRALLRIVLGQALSCEPASIVFCYGAHGKPTLAGDFRAHELSFNVSHSHNMATLVIAEGVDTGIDIERVRPDADFTGLARRYFSAGEARYLAGLVEEARPAAFFACWTRKEALVKALGMGISFGLNEFSVSMDPDEIEVRLHSDHPALSGNWRLYSFRPSPDYVCAVAVNNPCRHVLRFHEAKRDLHGVYPLPQ